MTKKNTEIHQTSPELLKHFKGLLVLKEDIRLEIGKYEDFPRVSGLLVKLYEKLDALIKQE